MTVPTSAVAFIDKPLSPDQWAAVITTSVGGAVSAILDVGRCLLQAKAELPHGDWQRLFRGHAHPVPHPVPFTIRTAQMFIKIAEHPILADAKHVSRLPAAWGTLHELTKVPDRALREALTDGRVHPEMARRDVAALRPHGPDAPSPPGRSARWDYPGAVTRLRDAVEREVVRCPAAQWPSLAAALSTIVKEIEAREPEGTSEAVPAPPPAVESEAAAVYRCTSCDRALGEDEVAEVRECPQCESRFDGRETGRNCPDCNRPFSRLITEQGCPDCLGEDGEVVPSDALEAAGR